MAFCRSGNLLVASADTHFFRYHGNTDSAIAFFLMLCVWLCSKQKLLAAAIALGVSIWIKLPTILAIPAFIVFIPKWRERLHFLVITAIVALSPHHGRNSNVRTKRPAFFDYRSAARLAAFISPARHIFSREQLARGPWAGGVAGLVASFATRNIRTLRHHRSKLRNRPGAEPRIFFSVFCLVVAVLVFLPRWFFVPATVLVSAYVYFLYAYLCSNPWLLGLWDFSGHPYWPSSINMVRNAAYLLFCAGAGSFVMSAILQACRPNALPS